MLLTLTSTAAQHRQGPEFDEHLPRAFIGFQTNCMKESLSSKVTKPSTSSETAIYCFCTTNVHVSFLTLDNLTTGELKEQL